MNLEKIKFTLKKWNSVFCTGMVCKTNVKRDAVVVSIAILAAAIFLYSSDYVVPREQDNRAVPISIPDDSPGIIAGQIDPEPVLTEDQISAEVESMTGKIDLSGWKALRNQFWGFTVKYPGDWQAPKIQSKSNRSKWEIRYQFRKSDTGENPYLGFDVVIYDVPKTKQLSNTDEYPKIRTAELQANSLCQNIEGHAVEIDDFPAEEIYVPPADDCYNPALFFSIIKERYIYNIVPVLKAGADRGNDPRIEINKNFPEYYSAASTLDLVEIVRPKPIPPKPKITAPKPVSFRVVGGKLVCAKKNDHPRKSRQNKGKHLDMECCLDPDETPNPWCTY